MELGLLYYNARYYVPGLGRFASADTIVPNPTNPQSYNRYSYGYNNPLNFTDPTGHDPDCPPLTSCPPLDFTDWEGWDWGDDEPTASELLAIGFCIQAGAACPAEIKFAYFGIPATEAPRNALISARARELCYASGECQSKEVGLYLGGIGLLLTAKGAVVFGLISTLYDVVVSASYKDYYGAAKEIGVEAAGQTADALLEANGLPGFGGVGIGAIDLFFDAASLSNTVSKYEEQAQRQIDLEVDQAERAFADAYGRANMSTGLLPCLCSSISATVPYAPGYQPMGGPLKNFGGPFK